jgi:hypothetical protein
MKFSANHGIFGSAPAVAKLFGSFYSLIDLQIWASEAFTFYPSLTVKKA